jgi:hypothetical protein
MLAEMSKVPERGRGRRALKERLKRGRISNFDR